MVATLAISQNPYKLNLMKATLPNWELRFCQTRGLRYGSLQTRDTCPMLLYWNSTKIAGNFAFNIELLIALLNSFRCTSIQRLFCTFWDHYDMKGAELNKVIVWTWNVFRFSFLASITVNFLCNDDRKCFLVCFSRIAMAVTISRKHVREGKRICLLVWCRSYRSRATDGWRWSGIEWNSKTWTVEGRIKNQIQKQWHLSGFSCVVKHLYSRIYLITLLLVTL
jgi:hypothetical protein